MLKIYRRAAVLLIAFCMLALTACSGGISPIKSDDDDLNIVANFLGKPIYLEEAEYLAYNFKLDMEAKYGEGIWDVPESTEKYRAELEEKVTSAMKENPTFLSL
ncbi:MAG: hypothetical protein IJZ89_00775, partial [Clostridia bacterium]|nr:hypothetical protein [Clostridia bacterium]